VSDTASGASIGDRTPQRASAIARLVASPAGKAVAIGGLLLLMLIPLRYVSDVIQEREARHSQ